jgi:amino acid transporter
MAGPTSSETGFGTFKGIFVPNVTMMFGVILFLRLSLVLGNVGIWQFLAIIGLSLGIMILTSLSIATIVTNMNVGGGGVYFLISRSLGIEIGGAIGLALVLAQVISMTLCVSGFAYSFHSLFPQFRIEWIELITMVCLGFLSFSSTDYALKTQVAIFFILLLSIGSVFFSQPLLDTPSQTPFFSPPLKFWQAFSLFYPALTGIEAGMALSGSLKKPSRALSIGNILSLLFVALIYCAMALFLWFTFSPQALSSNPLLVLNSSKLPALIYIGIWCATLSSALGNFLGAPRILQRIAEDNIAPEILGRSYGKYEEPRFAIASIFLVAVLLVLTTTMDQILPILTMICLLTYGTLNLVAGLAELISSPSWSPTFRTRWQYPIIGALGCLSLMLIIDPIWALISISLIIALYFFLRGRSLDVSFQDTRESIIFFFSRLALYRLAGKEENPKNWLPQVLALSRSTVQHEKMLRLGNEISGRSGILTVVTLLPEEWEAPEQMEKTKGLIQDWLKEKGIMGFSEVQACKDYYEGVLSLIKMHGIGPLQPNTILFPVTENEQAEHLYSIIETGTLNRKNLLFYFDASSISPKEFTAPINQRKRIDIWWDPSGPEAFELGLSLILTLRSSPIWNFRELNLITIASDENSKEHLKTYLNPFSKKMRLKCKVKIFIEQKDLFACVDQFSSSADLVLFPLHSCSLYEDNKEYRNYLNSVLETFKNTKTPLLGLLCKDTLKHREIYIHE